MQQLHDMNIMPQPSVASPIFLPPLPFLASQTILPSLCQYYPGSSTLISPQYVRTCPLSWGSSGFTGKESEQSHPWAMLEEAEIKLQSECTRECWLPSGPKQKEVSHGWVLSPAMQLLCPHPFPWNLMELINQFLCVQGTSLQHIHSWSSAQLQEWRLPTADFG